MRLLLLAGSLRVHFRPQCHFDDRDRLLLGWRNFWLAVCITAFIALIVLVSKACARFRF